VKASRPAAGLILVILIACTLHPVTLRADWRDVLWAIYIGPVTKSSPALDISGNIYIANDAGLLFSISPRGTTNWSAASSPGRSPAIGSDGWVYQGNRAFGTAGTLRAVLGVSPSAFGSNGENYGADTSGGVYCQTQLGTPIWTFLGGNSSNPGPELAIGASGEIYTGGSDFGFYAINSDGRLRWFTLSHNSRTFSPSIDGDGNICGPLGTNLVVLRPDGSTNFVFPAAADISTSVSVAVDGTLYFGDVGGSLYAVSTNYNLRPNGVPPQFQRWKFQPEFCFASAISSTPAISADGDIYFGTTGGVLYRLNTNGTGVTPPNLPGSGSLSAVTIGPKGNIYFAMAGGTLVALRGSAPLANSPWPMYRRDPRHSGRIGGIAISPPRIQSFTTSNYQARITFTTEWGRRYRLESSGDLANWNTVATMVTNTESATVSDTNWSAGNRFYRVASP
jgi:hypothetical protein